MNQISVTKAPEADRPDFSNSTNAGPTLQCAFLFFVASVSAFIGASLLLASI